MARRNVLIREFNVQVYADGRLAWDGLDSFLWWWAHRRPKEGLLPFAAKIARFGQQAHPAQKSK